MPPAGKPPLVLFEDDDLLAIHKPSGINTHKPGPYAQDGIHEWLTKQRPEWHNLSILHRLDKETSGGMVFGKSALANKSLTEQFERGEVKKAYMLLTSVKVDRQDACPTVSTPIQAKPARTSFRVLEPVGDATLVEAQPATGRTHQVRIHAAQAGFPILGDAQYGRARSGVPRVMLHAARLELRHPMTGLQLRLEAPTPRIFRNFDALVCAEEFRELLFDEATTNCHRLIASQADGFDGITADRFGEAMLVQTVAPHKPFPDSLSERHALFVQDLTPGSRTKPKQLTGNIQSFVARENGLNFLIRMDQGFSPGLFLDQRENRRHLREIARGKDVLNCFAYTCSFSVAAAAGGGKTTSLDLSKPYLDWGRDNFRANNLIPDQHDFIYGDVFDWLKRFAKRGRQWDIVLLDPPTFGTTKRGRVFRAARDYVELIQLAAKLVSRSGTLFCSTNQRSVSAKQFLTAIQRGLSLEKRGWSGIEFETQPFDFRVPEGEQPYLKTFWITLD